MTQKNAPGYPLPSGELGEDEIVCQLVYLPDRDEYWQALLGAISYMSTWRAWERDGDKRGKDAASNWRAAFELTMECWRMTCLEDLTTTVTDILELLQTKKDCCDDNITYLPTEEVETDIIPDTGDPPETYGETEVEDWAEWMEYLCYSAHKYVDYLAGIGDNLYVALRNGAIGMGVIAAALTLAAASGVLFPIAFASIVAIVAGILILAELAIFDDSESDIEAARAEIVCAIMLDGDLAGAVETALGSDTAWDVFYQFIPFDTAKAIMYEGGHDGEYLPAELRDDCECVGTTLFEYGPGGDDWFDPDFMGITFGGGIEELWPLPDLPGYKPNTDGTLRTGISDETGLMLRAQFGLGSGTLTIDRFTFGFLFYISSRWTFQFGIRDDNDVIHESPLFDSDDIGYGTYHEHTINFSPPIEIITDQEKMFQMKLYRTGGGDYPKSVVIFFLRGWSV